MLDTRANALKAKFSLQQLNKLSIGELRHLAAEKHGIKNAGLLKKPDLLARLKEHFQARHGVELEDEKEEVGPELSPISQTIDKLRSRIKVGCVLCNVDRKVEYKNLVGKQIMWVK